MRVALGPNDYVYCPNYNWKGILADLHDKGWTPYKVALALGADHGTVYGWIRGAEPRYSAGQGLRILHARICGERPAVHRETEAKERAHV